MDPVVEKNIQRWNAEQAEKKEKRERVRGLAVSALTAKLARAPREHEVREQIKLILAEKRAKWLLKNCRATVGEIIAQHKERS